MEDIMALPIAPTPILRGKEAVDFFRRIEEGLKKPIPLTPTPKLEKAKKLIKEYADRRKKQN
jgi:hypothetical protein